MSKREAADRKLSEPHPFDARNGRTEKDPCGKREPVDGTRYLRCDAPADDPVHR